MIKSDKTDLMKTTAIDSDYRTNHNFSDAFRVIIEIVVHLCHWSLCQYWLHWQLWSESRQLSGWSHFCRDVYGVCMYVWVCVCVCACVRASERPYMRVCVSSGCLLGSSAWCLSPSKWSFHQGNTVCFVRPAECLVFTLWRAVTSHVPSVKSQRGALSIAGIQNGNDLATVIHLYQIYQNQSIIIIKI